MSGWRGELVEVRQSPVHGLGVFAVAGIPAGTVWWSAELADTITISRAQFETLAFSAPSPASDALMSGIQEYSIYLAALDVMVLIPDNGRYVNHSDHPNSGASVAGTQLRSVALRDIATGEEITEDYGTYDHCPWAGIAPEFHDATAEPGLAVSFR
jgi:hypothetical protein